MLCAICTMLATILAASWALGARASGGGKRGAKALLDEVERVILKFDFPPSDVKALIHVPGLWLGSTNGARSGATGGIGHLDLKPERPARPRYPPIYAEPLVEFALAGLRVPLSTALDVEPYPKVRISSRSLFSFFHRLACKLLLTSACRVAGLGPGRCVAAGSPGLGRAAPAAAASWGGHARGGTGNDPRLPVWASPRVHWDRLPLLRPTGKSAPRAACLSRPYVGVSSLALLAESHVNLLLLPSASPEPKGPPCGTAGSSRSAPAMGT